MLQNDVKRGKGNDGFIIPKTDILGGGATSPINPLSPQKPKSHVGLRSTTSSGRTQQPRDNFVSYHKFLTSYWDHLPGTFIGDLGEEQ